MSDLFGLGPFFGRGDLRIGITRLAFETTDHRFSITDLLPDLIDFDREIVFRYLHGDIGLMFDDQKQQHHRAEPAGHDVEKRKADRGKAAAFMAHWSRIPLSE